MHNGGGLAHSDAQSSCAKHGNIILPIAGRCDLFRLNAEQPGDERDSAPLVCIAV